MLDQTWMAVWVILGVESGVVAGIYACILFDVIKEKKRKGIGRQ